MFIYNFVLPTKKLHTLNQIKQNHTALYFFVTSFCTLLYGLFVILGGNEKNVSVNLSGRDVIIDKFELTILFKIALLVLSVGYFVAQRLRMPLIKTLTRLHVFITIGSIIISLLISLFLPATLIEETCFWLVVIALSAQSLFIINMISGIVKRQKGSFTQEA